MLARTFCGQDRNGLKRFFVFFAAAFFAAGSIFCQKYSAEQEQGFEAFRKNDWASAMFFLRKAGSLPEGFDEETLYLLVMSEINACEYSDALSDVNVFLQSFDKSQYLPYMHFQKGRILHLLERNEEAVLVLSDFCHLYPDSELYAAALYWVAECFYDEYNFDSARALYERVVSDFPADAKAGDCRYRLEMIAQREREEKLIYLLKVTGEENLSAREEYERQIKLYQSQDKMGLRKSLADSQNRIAELEAELAEQKKVNSSLEAKVRNFDNVISPQNVLKEKNDEKISVPKTDPEIEALKQKALFLQFLLEEK
ncbi:tetratricopeptide repeat protein [Treponema sp. UBA7570]|uniref:tetratricopeptide repeat protein n=1 Tax=Treponema sp. UBA7570 TaxID=1947749 RepID=UPI0025EA117F|nr:tetratricopeptide repeat protein [Treponema sp. UBA7570]